MSLTFLEATARNLMNDFKASKAIHHNGLKGDIRENTIITNFLKKYLPQKYNISSGIIVNSDSKQSKQQDIIIYDAFHCPLLHNEENTKIIPIENVYSTIEVKSTLTKSELKKCIKNIESVKALDTSYTSPSGFVFAYQADSSIENVCKNLIDLNAETNPKHRINAMCILDKGIITFFHKHGLSTISVSPNENHFAGAIHGQPEKNLILFYLLLMTALSSKVVTPPDLLTYAEKQGLFAADYHIPHQDFPDDTFTIVPWTNEKLYMNQLNNKPKE
ncbi:DUF6602 domain-containing protein [Bacillus wiedmannii]|uniref:DUF6602 domain-containing protein n=1 Tax=Bacillus wiedmannii TaxID=1890302 RepID=UPI003CEB9D6E